MNTLKLITDYIDENDWRVKENSNTNYSFAGLQGHIASACISDYALNTMYKGKIAEAHKRCFFHLHDLGSAVIGYCTGWGTETLVKEGFNMDNRFVWSNPPKHFNTLLEQINNFIFTLAGEWAGAQALNSFDTFLAPFIREDNLTYNDVKKSIQNLIFNLNVKTRVQMQSPFSNISVDIVPPKDIKYRNVIVGGKELEYTYADCQKEMDMLNKALIEVMLEGDSKGKPFTFPIITYNIGVDFPWDSEIAEDIFKLGDEIGSCYYQNFISSGLNPDDVRSMCCRLSLDTRELKRNTGGIFGSSDSTGSIGVVTLNLPRMAFMAKKIAMDNKTFKNILEPFDDLVDSIDKLKTKYKKEELMIKIFYVMIDYFMNLAKNSLVIKRNKVEEMYKLNMMPYTSRYLKTFKNHFNTIGVNGGHECLLNLFGYGIETEQGNKFMSEVLQHMLDNLSDYQEEYSNFYGDNTGLLFNLEATPAEGTGTRFAKHDLDDFNNEIITANGHQLPYYTNSTQLPQDYTENIFDVFENQNSLQPLYTSGTVQHIYLNEPVHNWKTSQNLIRKLFEHYKLPYVSLSPNICVCPIHGRLPKTYEYCPYDHTPEEIEELKNRGYKFQ